MIFQDYEIGDALGTGGFATVVYARCCNTGQDVAIKKVQYRTLFSPTLWPLVTFLPTDFSGLLIF